MSVQNTVTDLMNRTAYQGQRTNQIRDTDGVWKDYESPPRNTNGVMGKDDFLMLLSAQLRYQNPLEPNSDSDFAAQLAQFSALEQMVNLNTTMSAFANQQTFSLIGKGVMGMADIDNVYQPYAGIVDNVFISDGVQWAVIIEDSGTTIRVPVSSITGAYDSASLLTPSMFINTSNNLIGREVKADWKDETIEGIVTRITVEDGFMFARIEKDDGTSVFVPVGAIYDIRQPGTSGEDMPKEEDDENEDETIIP